MTQLTIRRAARGGLLVAIVAGGLAVAGPAGPALADSQGAAFVWSYQAAPPLGTPYTPYGPYQYNSTSPGDPGNTVTRQSTGHYVVRIPGMVGFGATQATAYGGDAAYCNAGDTIASSFAQVDVLCFTASGAPTDHLFTLSFTNVTDPAQANQLAYLEVESDGTVFANRQYNSGGAPSTVTRDGSAYLVRIPGLGAVAGHVQVSGADGLGSRCKVVNWGPAGVDQLIRVQCWQAGTFGIPANAPFILTYVNQQNILGLPTADHASAYAWANLPREPSYGPFPTYLYSSAQLGATITRTAPGVYGVSFAGIYIGDGDVQVTAYGWGQQFCNVAQWIDDIQVRCFDWDGTPADSQYTVTFTG